MGKAGFNEENLSAQGLRLAIVASQYNPSICEGLLEGAMGELENLGLKRAQIEIHRVPGAMELPLTAKLLAQAGRYDGIICLGAVIQGDTRHFDYVCQGATYGVVQAMLDTGVPVAFGLLTTENEQQAIARSSQNQDNKGREAARTAVVMAHLKKQI